MFSIRQPLVASPPEETSPAARDRDRVGAPSSGSSWSVVVAEDEAALSPHVGAWEELAAAALEANPFYEPWMFLPALRLYGTGVRLRIVLVFTFDPDTPAKFPLLCGFFPLEWRGSHKRLPVPVLKTWQYLHCYLGLPLVRAGYARECLAAFFDFLGHDRRGAGLVEFRTVPAEGPWQDLLTDHCRIAGLRAFVSEHHQRAFFRSQADAPTFLATSLGKNTKKSLKRHQKDLAKEGRVEYLLLEPDGNVDSWMKTFLSLEAGGWKGRAGTALACNEKDRTFFAAVVGEAFRRGLLLMLALHLNGRPIACQYSFLSPPLGGVFFKTAFDEAYARFSPGFLLEIENIRRLHALPGLRWIDSCTSADNDLLNRLWPERKSIQTVTVATGRKMGHLVVAVLPFFQWLRGMVFRPRSSTPTGHATQTVKGIPPG